MDDIVKQALVKWPNVPDARGWLALDARGNWWLRDAATQARGAFPHSKGTLVEHEKLRAFIERNYEADALGLWFFQNGPQRVYVELENTPMVWRVHSDGSVYAHTGAPQTQVQGCWMDEEGRVYLQCTDVLGVVHSQDMVHVANAVEQGRWQPQDTEWAMLPQRFHFVRSPQQASEGDASASSMG